MFEGVGAAQLVEMIASKTIPYTDDLFMFNYSFWEPDASTIGVYSEHWAKRVAWDRAYNRFYRQACGYCDWGPWPNFVNLNATAGDYWGTSPEAEPAFLNAVTGKNMSFADGMEIGRKIWNLQKAIWVLQGRDRDMEVWAGFMFKPGASGTGKTLPVYNSSTGTWSMETESLWDVYMDRDALELFKDRFYTLEGWDLEHGWPTRSTLEGLGLDSAADELEAAGRLGSE